MKAKPPGPPRGSDQVRSPSPCGIRSNRIGGTNTSKLRSALARLPLSGVTDRSTRLPSRTTAALTVRPSGVSVTSRLRWRTPRTRSPSNSVMTSPFLMPAFSAALPGADVVDHRPGLALGLIGVQLPDRDPQLRAPSGQQREASHIRAELDRRRPLR